MAHSSYTFHMYLEKNKSNKYYNISMNNKPNNVTPVERRSNEINENPHVFLPICVVTYSESRIQEPLYCCRGRKSAKMLIKKHFIP